MYFNPTVIFSLVHSTLACIFKRNVESTRLASIWYNPAPHSNISTFLKFFFFFCTVRCPRSGSRRTSPKRLLRGKRTALAVLTDMTGAGRRRVHGSKPRAAQHRVKVYCAKVGERVAQQRAEARLAMLKRPFDGDGVGGKR